MEMESTRRSLDRSKEPGILKKPRLAEAGEREARGALGAKGGAGPDRDRPLFLARGGPAGGVAPDPVSARFRAGERERELDQPPSAAAYRASSYQQQQQQMQELAAQYKTALAELTFNSKPIITNLTIIAGENLHAAKAIAAIVCANILEVPSEQKLPSLYLLDSIVKNIGRDYIKYFAARLPEVFCKAYKQVDSSIHPGMRHLFGTWKGVFPPAPLLAIEKELGFPPIINGSSSGGGSRPDSQAQRPPHSIHVNPKYLEARQQLQQPNRVKGISSDNVGRVATTIEDVERPGRVTVIGSSRQWADPSVKNIQQPERDLSNESAREKNPGVGYVDHEFVSDYSRHSDSGISRTSGRFAEREISNKPWDSVGKSMHEVALDQRNGSDANHACGNYISGQTIIQPSSNKPNTTNKSGLITSQNWKNSEEEEYMWDDVNSRLMDPGSSNTSSWSPDDSEKPTSLRRAKRIVPEMVHLESKRNRLDTLTQLGKAAGKEDRVPSFRGTEEHLPTAHLQHDSGSRADREPSADSLSTGGSVFGHRTPGLWSSQKMKASLGGSDIFTSRIPSQQEGHPVPGSDELSTSMDLSFPRMGVHFTGPSVAAVSSNLGSSLNPGSACSAMIDRKHQQPLRSPSPSADVSSSSALLQPKNLHKAADHDHLKPQKSMQFSGQLKRVVPSQVTPESFSTNLQNDIQQSENLPNSEQLLSKISQNIKMSSASSTPFSQLQHHPPFLQQPESDPSVQQLQRESHSSIHSQELVRPPLSFGSTLANGSSGTSNLINSGGDVLDQSSASKLLAAIMKSGLISSTPAASLENLTVQPPLPSGPPPVQAVSMAPSSVPFSSALAPVPQGYIQPPAAHPSIPVLPPLPPGPPPQSSLVGSSPQVVSAASTNTNPLSSLLSSLVSKGLISSSGTKPSDSTTAEIHNQLPSQSSILPTSTCMPFGVTSASSIVPLASSSSEPPRPESSSPKGDVLSKSITEDAKGLIGLQFKPEVIREFHPSVIDGLYDDMEHQCIKCGLRFKVQEDIHRHFDLHAFKSEMGNFDQISRKWYENSDEWVARRAETLCGSVYRSLKMTVSNPEKCESMVPADENQCICALCGEPFEDFYCEQRDEWMYRGTVYMNQQAGEGSMKHMDKEEVWGPIVHAKCVSRNTSHEFEAAIDKMEQARG